LVYSRIGLSNWRHITRFHGFVNRSWECKCLTSDPKTIYLKAIIEFEQHKFNLFVIKLHTAI